MSEELTCKDRVADFLTNREDFVGGLFECADNDVEHDEINDPIDFLYSEFALDIEKKVMVKILLSTGGPGDWLECYVESDTYDIYRIEYHMNDWFDHASVVVDNDSPLWRYAEMIVEAVSFS